MDYKEYYIKTLSDTRKELAIRISTKRFDSAEGIAIKKEIENIDIQIQKVLKEK